MTFTVEAIWQEGVLKLKEPIALPEGAEVRVSITLAGEETDPLADVIGIGDGPAVGDAADRHDHYIYGNLRS